MFLTDCVLLRFYFSVFGFRTKLGNVLGLLLVLCLGVTTKGARGITIWCWGSNQNELRARQEP